ncbi:MAG: hypothetical protein WBJ41_00855 [Chromatiaceae bacterium]
MPPNHTKFSLDESQAMKTDKQIYTLFSADPDFLRLLTGGIAVRGAYQFADAALDPAPSPGMD